MNRINLEIGNFYIKQIESKNFKCKLCGKVASFTSSTMKGHIGGGEIAKKLEISSCENPDEKMTQRIIEAYAEQNKRKQIQESRNNVTTTIEDNCGGALSFASKHHYKLTIISDGATISKVPLTNYLAIVPERGVVFIDYDDATSHDQSGGAKDRQYIYQGIRNTIEEVGRSNIMLVVTDCAPVMKAAWNLIEQEYSHVFCIGCLPHQVNTFIKHIRKNKRASRLSYAEDDEFDDIDEELESQQHDNDYDIEDSGKDSFAHVGRLIAKCKAISKHFGNIHDNRAKLRTNSNEHCGGKDYEFIIP